MQKRTQKQWIKLTDKVVAHTYARFPVAFVKGKGMKLYDAEGNEYLDFLAGISTVSLGHCHGGVTRALKKQAGELVHVSNLYHIPGQSELANRLVKLSFADRAFFCNSGAEANEAAIKLARKWAQNHKRGHEIITAMDSFHGRTLATVSATGQEKYHKGFEPLPEGFPKIPYGDIGAAKKAITRRTAAVMVEPIQAEGGIIVPPKGYLKALRELCDKKGCLLIYDEVQTGIGRTGHMFGYQHDKVVPDIMTLAKALGNGMPIGCMMARESVVKFFDPGSHASTFGGNPLACAAAKAVLDEMTKPNFLKGVRRRGEYLRKQLMKLKDAIPGAVELRGRGMLWGIEINGQAGPYIKKALENGLLIGGAGPNVLRFAPPLVATEKDIDRMMYIMTNYVLGQGI